VRVEGVSKKFCRSLKQSLWYGLGDMASELNPFTKGKEVRSNGPTESELRPGEFWAVNGVSFELRRGECLGLIGHNGAGKTTLLKMLNGLIKPDAGSITMRGRIGALIALGAGFNPILTGRENIYVNGSVLGLTKEEIDGKLDDIIDFAGLRDFIDTPVQSYSSGMQVRLGFSVATALEPDVLILDEVLAVGDRSFRSKCMARVSQLLERCAVIFVSHSAADIQQICDMTVWLVKGEMRFVGGASEGLRKYAAAADQAQSAVRHVHSPFTHADIKATTTSISQGGDLELVIETESTEDVVCDFCVGALVSEAGETVAQFHPSKSEFVINAGRCELKFTVRDVRLVPGKYTVNVNCCRNAGKSIMFHLIQCGHFESVGGSYLWSAYQPESTFGS
jgi:lipopolysaccharide transport system ATP-binding protein